MPFAKIGIMKKPQSIVLSDAERAALARLASGTTRIAYRAKGVLLLADGLSKAAVARRLVVGEGAVRAWQRRWLAGGGLDALRHRSKKRKTSRQANQLRPVIPDLPARTPATEAELLRGATTGRGRPLSTRIAIEAWVRDAAALGLIAPGARLPNQTWFAKRFHAASHTVATAFTSLARQGFVNNRRRIGSFLSRPLPFEKRYLLLLSTRGQGLDNALKAAATEQERRRGVRWDIIEATPQAEKKRMATIKAAIAAQRWAGLFLRTSPSTHLPGWEFLGLDRVPISGMVLATDFLGERVIPLRSYSHDSPEGTKRIADTVFAAIRAAGRSRILVFDSVSGFAMTERFGGLVRRLARDFGLEIPESCYQILNILQQEQNEGIFSAALRVAAEENIDAVAILQDNFASPVCDALVARFGEERASRLFLAAFGNRPAIPETRLPVTWHGFDLSATLDSFVDWCDAIHAGEKAPPPPVLATF